MKTRRNQLVPARRQPLPTTYRKITLPVPNRPRNDWERAGVVCLGAAAVLLFIGAVTAEA